MPIAESKKRMEAADLKARTKAFALRIFKLEEADESLFWLELIVDASLVSADRIRPLIVEADEIVAIMATSRKSAIANRRSAIP